MAQGIRDVYSNFFPLKVTGAVNSTTLANANHNTSMGPSTRTAWRIHGVEIMPHKWPTAAAGCYADFALTTRKDLAVMPTIDDMGCVLRVRIGMEWSTSGGHGYIVPVKLDYLPPILVASANLSMLVQSSVNDAAIASQVHRMRLIYTMVALDSAAYQELFQTWNFAS